MTARDNLSHQFEPLPIEPGLYYRSHLRGVPFGPNHAKTQPLEIPDQEGSGISKETHERLFAPKPGYSSFWNPHHVEQYHDEMGWSMKGRRIIAFRGTPVGEGSDSEPRVMPASSHPEFSMSPSQFQNRLARTPNGYGRWDEHTWGDGPNGQIVDDGYRRIDEL